MTNYPYYYNSPQVGDDFFGMVETMDNGFVSTDEQLAKAEEKKGQANLLVKGRPTDANSSFCSRAFGLHGHVRELQFLRR